jgi:hypothetical protein
MRRAAPYSPPKARLAGKNFGEKAVTFSISCRKLILYFTHFDVMKKIRKLLKYSNTF